MATLVDQGMAKEITVALISHASIPGLTKDDAEEWGELVGKIYSATLQEIAKANA